MRFPQATLKENVLFGQPYDDKKFWDVIESCGLAPDLDQLPAAEETGIGEKGINLSGESRTHTHTNARARVESTGRQRTEVSTEVDICGRVW
jgi:ABC-type transport system involved in cytochrome bd biosynthesis fused ATPase/permease subunit